LDSFASLPGKQSFVEAAVLQDWKVVEDLVLDEHGVVHTRHSVVVVAAAVGGVLEEVLDH
jgi:hypothetical protein